MTEQDYAKLVYDRARLSKLVIESMAHGGHHGGGHGQTKHDDHTHH
jgi:hypothetical protein